MNREWATPFLNFDNVRYARRLVPSPHVNVVCVVSSRHLSGACVVSSPHVNGACVVSSPHLSGACVVSSLHLNGTCVVSSRYLNGAYVVSSRHLSGACVVTSFEWCLHCVVTSFEWCLRCDVMHSFFGSSRLWFSFTVNPGLNHFCSLLSVLLWLALFSLLLTTIVQNSPMWLNFEFNTLDFGFFLKVFLVAWPLVHAARMLSLGFD
jgi:hypothetical protein